MKIRLLLVLFLSLFFIGLSNATEEKKVIRVAISNQNFSNYIHQKIKISSSNQIKMLDMSNSSKAEVYPANSKIEIVFNQEMLDVYVNDELKAQNLFGPLVFGSNSNLEITELNRKGIPAKYDGLFEIKINKTKSGFNLINVVDSQNYLRGVVPNEMPQSFGLEALKAQSVAARNYANNAQISPDYDVVDSTASQVYYGINSYKEISDLAIEQTKGIYALYDEKPITALYFSTSPGITDDWDDVFGNGIYSGKHPYLKARYDFNEKPLNSEKDVENFYSKKDNGLDVNSPKFRWEFEFDRTELEEILHTTLQQQSKTNSINPIYDGTIKLEGLKEIKPLKRTQSGKITELEIISKTGNYKIKNQLAIRRVFKKNNAMLPTTNFYVEASKKEDTVLDNEKTDDDVMGFFDFPSSNKYPKSFKFIGGGFGHGVGMSQYGAYNLALKGKKYPEILNHYYTDIKISTMPKIVDYNEYNVSLKTEFYFEKDTYKSAYLFINNQRGASEFPFKINEYSFDDTKDISNKKIVKINITEYLKDGQNFIDFAPLSFQNKGKYVIYRVEFNNE